MENKFKQLCGLVDYNTYNKIQKFFECFSLGMILPNYLFLLQYPNSYNPIFNLMCLSFVTFLGLEYSHGIEYTKDIKQIKSLYQEFITNYNKLNKIFNLNDPIEIHTMFNYLLYKGYLSVSKSFEFSDQEARDINGLYGANVIVGKSVCRHISVMLTDILNNYGIESYPLCVFQWEVYSKEELIKWVQANITDVETYSFLIEFIEKILDNKNQSLELSIEMSEDKSKIKNSNHKITLSFKDGKSYYLDPTNNQIYRVSQNDTDVLYSDGVKAKIILSSSNKSKDISIIKDRLSQQYPSVSKEEEKQLIEQTTRVCNGNMDIFEQFYTENRELYSDISSRVLNIKKREIKRKK